MATPVAQALRWSDVPVHTTDDVAALLLRKGLEGPPPRAWFGGRDAPAIGGLPKAATNALELPVGGHAILTDAVATSADGIERLRGPVWYDLRDGRTTSFRDVPETGPRRRMIAGHQEGPRVAVAEMWAHQPATPGRPWEDARVTVSLLDSPEGKPRTLLETPAQLWGDRDTETVQWSPDGTRLAISFIVVDAVTGWYPVLRVLRAADGEVLGEWPQTALVGSASWTPDSRALLVEVQPLALERRATVVLDLADDGRRPTAVPPLAPDGTKPIRPLALVGDDRLLFLEEVLGGDSVLSTSTTDGRDVEEVLRWRALGPSRPRVPTLAPDVWEGILAAQRAVNAR